MRMSCWEPTVGVVMNTGRTAIALRAGAGLFVLMVGCGAVAGGVSQSGAPTPTTATSALSSETPPPPKDPGDPTGGGGALPVRPIICYAGLNCGCIRGITCPGTIPHHHHPAPTNDQPHDAPGDAPAGGG
jgi:hypothetical protein